MNGLSKKLITIAAVGACSASTAVFADNPAGFYLGAGIGESNLRSDGYGYNELLRLRRSSSRLGNSWPACGRSRRSAPNSNTSISASAATATNYSYGNYYFNGYDGDAKAAALFGVGYLPLPLPFLDISAKRASRACEAKQPNTTPGCCAEPASVHASNATPFSQRCRLEPTSPTARACSSVSRSSPARRVRAHQLAVRRPRSLLGGRHLGLLRPARTFDAGAPSCSVTA